MSASDFFAWGFVAGVVVGMAFFAAMLWLES